MKGPIDPATYVAEDCLIWHQGEVMALVLWRLDTPVQGDAKAMRQEEGIGIGRPL